MKKMELSVLLEHFPDEKDTEYLLSKAVNGYLQIAFMHQTNNQFEPLTPGDLGLIKSVGKAGRVIVRSHNLQWKDLWCDTFTAKNLMNERLNSNNFSSAVLNYTTPLIEIQRKAIEKFWLKYDPDQPPKKDVIMAWLINEFKLLQSEADAIDKIIRPKAYKMGGNKPRKNPKPLTQKS